MTLITSWSLQSPDGTNYQPSISAAGVVTFTAVGAPVSVSPPVYADQESALVWTPSISNGPTPIVTLTSGADTGQLRAALIDPNGAQYLASVIENVAYFLAPRVNVGDLVTFGLFDQEAVPLLVKSIEPGADLTARLTLVDAAPGVHLAAEGEIPPFESHITLPRIGQEPVPKPLIDHIASDETVMLRSTDGSLTPRIVVSLHFASGAIAPAAFVEVQHRPAGSSAPWDRLIFPASSLVELSILAVQEGLNYDLRFRSIGTAGQTSDWVTIYTYAVVGKTSPPPDVTGLSLNGNTLVWLYPDEPVDFSGFHVRVHVGRRTSWGDAMPLHDGVITLTQFTLFRDSGERTYLVKGEDTSLNDSLNPATIFVDWGAIATQNVAEIIDLKTLGFPGTITEGSVLGGDLVADDDTLFWKDDGLPFWIGEAEPFWDGTFREMQYIATVTPPFAWLGGILLLDLIVDASGWRLDYAQDSGGPFWGDEAVAFWGDDADPFWIDEDTVWVPWPGQLTTYTRQAYQIRLTTNGGSIQGHVEQFQIIFDMPDLEEILLNVLLEATGTRLPVTKPFSAILVVAPTVVEDGSGAVRIRVLDKEAIGPLTLGVDSNQSPVECHGDFVVKGY